MPVQVIIVLWCNFFLSRRELMPEGPKECGSLLDLDRKATERDRGRRMTLND
jgi:hypothetical protein